MPKVGRLTPATGLPSGCPGVPPPTWPPAKLEALAAGLPGEPWPSREAPAAELPCCDPNLPAPSLPPPGADGRVASAMSFTAFVSTAWSWATSFAISCRNV
ncbi:unnamed protein product, partial [Laminaria digitata]